MKRSWLGHRLTVEQFVNQHKVILHRFFVEFAKIRFTNGNKFVEEFKDEGSVHILFGRGRYEKVFMTNVEEGDVGVGGDGRANVRIGHDLNAKDIGSLPSDSDLL